MLGSSVGTALAGGDETSGRGVGTEDNTPCNSCGGSGIPTHTEETSIDRNEFGYTVNYYTSAGSTIEQVDSVYYPELDKWSYVFRTEATANAVKEDGNGDTYKYETYDADKRLRVAEQNRTGDVNTQYYRDSDWGYGVTTGEQKNYDWQDATVDTLRQLEGEFVPVVSQLHSASNIVSYWKKAAKDDSSYDGIDVTWDGQYRQTSHVGAYAFYEHKFPPESEFADDYVRVHTTNELKNTLFYSDGTEYPNGDYTHTWKYEIEVKPDPSTQSAMVRTNNGIVEQTAGEYFSERRLAVIDVDPDETIYVDTAPRVRIVAD